MRFDWLILAVSATVLLGVEPLLANEQLKAEFLKEYEPAAKRLKEEYSNVHLQVDATVGVTGKTDKIRQELWGQNGRWRLDSTYAEVGVHGQPVGTESVYVATPQVSLRARRESLRPYSLYQKDSDPRDILASIERDCAAAFAPTVLMGESILEFVRTPALDVVSLDSVTVDKKPFKRLLFSVRRGPEFPDLKGYILFEPAENWACHGHWMGSFEGPVKDSEGRLATVTYGERQGKVRPILRYEHYYYLGKEPPLVAYVGDVKSFDANERIPAELFAAAAIGITLGDASHAVATSPFVVIASGVLVVIGLILFCRHRSLRTL
jgi:hypothetical protein